MAQIIDGKKLAEQLTETVTQENTEDCKHHPQPCLAIVSSGSDPASQVYIKSKIRALEKAGMQSKIISYTETVNEQALIALQAYGIPINGAHAVIVGRSTIVGKPLSALLTAADATVTLCHSKTKDLAVITRQADILIAAAGHPALISGDMVKKEATVIDVGINRIPDPSSPKNTRLIGDVDFQSVAQRASRITPVPGGVGPLTVAMVLRNTLRAAMLRHGYAPEAQTQTENSEC